MVASKKNKSHGLLLLRLDKYESKLKSILEHTSWLTEANLLFYRQLRVINEIRDYLNYNPFTELKFPDFMIVGSPRVASTWSKLVISQNKNVLFSLGEPRYFSKYFLKKIDHYLKCLEPVRHNFRHFRANRVLSVGFANFIQGEKNPDYMMLPELQVKFIRILMPKVKIILLVRDPIDACWSNIKFEFGRPDRKEVRQHLDLENVDQVQVKSTCRVWKPFWSYSSSIKHWKKYFKDFLIIQYDDISENPAGEAQKIFDFIGAPPCDLEQESLVSEKVNQARTDVEMPDWCFEMLKTIFAEEYEHWYDLFGRPPKYIS